MVKRVTCQKINIGYRMNNKIIMLLTSGLMMFSSTLSASNGCAFSDKQDGFIATCSEEKQEVILTGVVTAQTLVTELEEFSTGYHDYTVDSKAIEPLKDITTPTEIVVIIGTWCPDCHRETPRFIRIIEQLNNPNISVSYIGVDRSKADPQGLAANYEFTRIPTFIVKQQDREIGRIVERPTVSLEVDLANVLTQ